MRLGERSRGHAGPGHDPDVPTPGCYEIRLRKDAPTSAVRIWLGHSLSPEGEEMTERSPHWQCELNGQRVSLEQCWPGCARRAISQEEHDRIVARNDTMDPSSP